MKKFIYLLAILATSANAQTIKTLGYNTTNGQVSYSGSNSLTFTNTLQFATNTRAATRTNLELGGTWLTNTNVANFRAAIGLATTNAVSFSSLQLSGTGNLGIGGMNVTAPDSGLDLAFTRVGTTNMVLRTNGLILHVGSYSFSSGNTNGAATTRTNLSLGWSALTNTNAGTGLVSVTANTNGVDYNVVNFVTNTNSSLIFTNNQTISMFGASASLFQHTSYLGIGWKVTTNTSEFSKARFFVDGLYLGSSLATNKVITWNIASPFWRIDIAPSFAAGVASTFAGNLLLGPFNTAEFAAVTLGGDLSLTPSSLTSSDFDFLFNWEEKRMADGGTDIFSWDSNANINFYNAVSFNQPAVVRTNLGLRLPALTNTSNVTTMRALAGSTNTNEPYSGTVALTNTNVLTFSNGVLLKIQ